ncbi:polysaccharide biosynthesis/export family protein [Hansschlegelia quercus]|nr:polysaccharide biosynthesis/export family protein [Hansschlegelia quercus]
MGATSLAGCAALPAAGPNGASTTTGVHRRDTMNYAVVKLTPAVISTLPPVTLATFTDSFTSRTGAPDVRVGVGDTVRVTIFEAASGGLFVPAEGGTRQGNYVEISPQQIDQSGTLSVPFAGSIAAAGRTPAQIQAVINDRLRSRAIEPNAIVTVSDRQSASVSVLGEVNVPTRYSLTPKGERIMDAIARAQGSKFPDYETIVTVQRGSQESSALLSRIIAEPSQNIYVRPGDSVYLSHNPRYFYAFGSTGQSTFGDSARFSLTDRRVSLADALGMAGGLVDARADASSLLVYRMVPCSALARMGTPVPSCTNPEMVVPTIFIVDLRTPSGYFLAQQFALQERDLLYISTAATVELNKIFDVFTSGANAVQGVRRAKGPQSNL